MQNLLHEIRKNKIVDVENLEDAETVAALDLSFEGEIKFVTDDSETSMFFSVVTTSYANKLLALGLIEERPDWIGYDDGDAESGPNPHPPYLYLAWTEASGYDGRGGAKPAHRTLFGAAYDGR